MNALLEVFDIDGDILLKLQEVCDLIVLGSQSLVVEQRCCRVTPHQLLVEFWLKGIPEEKDLFGWVLKEILDVVIVLILPMVLLLEVLKTLG